MLFYTFARRICRRFLISKELPQIFASLASGLGDKNKTKK